MHSNKRKSKQVTDLRLEKFKKRSTSIVDIVIEMSSVAITMKLSLSGNYGRHMMQTNRLDGSSYFYIVCC